MKTYDLALTSEDYGGDAMLFILMFLLAPDANQRSWHRGNFHVRTGYAKNPLGPVISKVQGETSTVVLFRRMVFDGSHERNCHPRHT
jgi:hypothetical protein